MTKQRTVDVHAQCVDQTLQVYKDGRKAKYKDAGAQRCAGQCTRQAYAQITRRAKIKAKTGSACGRKQTGSRPCPRIRMADGSIGVSAPFSDPPLLRCEERNFPRNEKCFRCGGLRQNTAPLATLRRLVFGEPAFLALESYLPALVPYRG